MSQEQWKVFPVIVVLIIIAVIIYAAERKKNKFLPPSWDLVIQFRDDCYHDIRKNKRMMQVAEWEPYSSNSFRGSSLLPEDELSKCIMEEYGIAADSFRIIKPYFNFGARI